MIASYKKVSKKLYSVLVKEKGRERRKKKNVFIQSKLVILTQILVSILIIWLKLLFILNFFTNYKQKKTQKKGVTARVLDMFKENLETLSTKIDKVKNAMNYRFVFCSCSKIALELN